MKNKGNLKGLFLGICGIINVCMVLVISDL